MGKKSIDDRGLLSKEANEALDREMEPGEGVRAVVRGTYGSAIVGTVRVEIAEQAGRFRSRSAGGARF